MTNAEDDPVSLATLRSLSRSVLKILRCMGHPEVIPSVDIRLEAVVDDLEPQKMRMLLEVTRPLLAIEGHDELLEEVQNALLPRAPAA